MELIKKYYDDSDHNDLNNLSVTNSSVTNQQLNNPLMTNPLMTNQKLRPNWDNIFMENIIIFAKRSLCLKLQTAAIVVYNTQILSIGYNGTFSKSLECNNYWYQFYLNNIINITYEQFLSSDKFASLHREWSLSNEVHAEANALKWITPNTDNKYYIMYSLYSPCNLCAKEIITYGIKKFVYKYKYKHGDDALKLLKKYNIEVINL